MIANDNNRPLTIYETSPAHRTRSRRGFWVLLAVPLAAAALSMSVARAHGFGGGPEGGGGGGMGPGAFMQHRMEKLLEAAGATDAQKTQIKAIWEPLRPQLKTLHQQHADLHEQIGQAIAAPTIDAARIEQLRHQAVQLVDKTSALTTQAMVASAQVLTPEQRKIVLQKMQEHRGHRPHGEE